ncbi:MAG TPA: protein phosphatase 2C domain-containing protein [Dongiaceae bacterium]|nr:protein phosphatase 2C domain-containing protein [Dongiaceae bacterium]
MTSAFTLLCAASAPGSRINEDAYGVWPAAAAPRAAWVLDGVTGINDRAVLPGPSDAAWFVAQVQDMLPALLAAAPAAPIADLLGALVHELDQRQSASWLDPRGADGRETPAASFALARLIDGKIEIARLGDCLVLLESEEGAVRVLDSPALQRIEAETKRAILGLWAAGIADPAEIRERMMPMLRAQRHRRNQFDGYGVLAAEENCLSKIEIDRLPARACRRVLLASDGYYRLVDHYNAVSDTQLMRETERIGADALLKRLRAIEGGDARGDLYPRLKMSDDATAVLLGIGAIEG